MRRNRPRPKCLDEVLEVRAFGLRFARCWKAVLGWGWETPPPGAQGGSVGSGPGIWCHRELQQARDMTGDMTGSLG